MNAAYSLLASWRCPHCDSSNKLIAVAGSDELDRFLLEVSHEDGCPDAGEPDDAPAAEYTVEHDTVRGPESV